MPPKVPVHTGAAAPPVIMQHNPRWAGIPEGDADSALPQQCEATGKARHSFMSHPHLKVSTDF